MATTTPARGCFEWCDLGTTYGRLLLGFAFGGLVLAAGTWRGNLFCMGIALFVLVMGVLIATFFALTIVLSGRAQIAALIPFGVTLVLAVPIALLSLALIALNQEGERG